MWARSAWSGESRRCCKNAAARNGARRTMSPASGRSGASGESAGIAERGTSGIKDGAIGSGIAREAAAKAQRCVLEAGALWLPTSG